MRVLKTSFDYFKSILKENRIFWIFVNRKRSNSRFSQTMDFNGKEYSGPYEISEAFGDFSTDSLILANIIMSNSSDKCNDSQAPSFEPPLSYRKSS